MKDTTAETGRKGAAGTPRLSVRGLSKRYGNIQALDAVDFELRAGEVMALLGENGAGKSTLVKALAGLVAPDTGTIEIDGQPVDLYPSARSQAAGVAVVHQEYSLVPAMTVAENLVLGQGDAPDLWWPGRLNRRARPLLELVGLQHLDPRTRVEQLSVAEMQLVEIARLLGRDARILIFDEPTAALADREIERILRVVRRLADEGRSVIYVTHRLAEVFRLSDRVTVFRNGRSLPATPTAELDVAAVITTMLGRELGTMFPDRGQPEGAPLLEVDGLVAPGLAEPVSLAVRPGEILGLTGQLGSGAADVVRCVAGLSPPLAGTVRIAGSPARLGSRKAALAQGLAYCSADRKRDGIFFGRPIRENLSSPWLPAIARLGVFAPRAERAAALPIAGRFAIDTARLGTPVGAMSGGNQQKVAVGKWLGATPRVMLLDEPTRGVDVGARAEIYRRLRELCDEGMAIVVASSDTAEVFGLCDSIATFYRGRLTALRPHAEWTEDAVVREVMHEETPA